MIRRIKLIRKLTSTAAVKVADQVWIATALLHRAQPDRSDFTIQEILARARKAFGKLLRAGAPAHTSLQCVANRPPNPGTYRMLYATGKRTRRLYRPDDEAHPLRRGKITPKAEEIPARYRELLRWYESEYRESEEEIRKRYEPLYLFRGLGKEIWQGIDPDEYVRSLRED